MLTAGTARRFAALQGLESPHAIQKAGRVGRWWLCLCVCVCWISVGAGCGTEPIMLRRLFVGSNMSRKIVLQVVVSNVCCVARVFQSMETFVLYKKNISTVQKMNIHE